MRLHFYTNQLDTTDSTGNTRLYLWWRLQEVNMVNHGNWCLTPTDLFNGVGSAKRDKA